MKHNIFCLTVVSMLTLAIGSAWAAGAYLPFGDGFETKSPGDDLQSPWSATWDAWVTNAPETPKDGSENYAYVSDDVDLDMNAGYIYSNVWWSVYAKPTLHSDSANPDPGDSVAAFFVTTNGTVKARSNAAWVVIASIASPNDWIGFGVHLDYSNRAYDVYLTEDGYEYGDPLVKANDVPLAFSDSGSAATDFTQFSAEGTTRFDNMVLSRGNTPVSVAKSSDNLVNVADNIFLQEGPSGALVKYFDEAGRTMAGPMGAALFGSLLEGDKIKLKSDGGWITLTRQSDGSGSWDSDPGTNLSSIVLSATSGMYIEFGAGSGERQLAGISGYDTISGATNITITPGLHLLAVPMDANKNLDITAGDPGIGLPDPNLGDILYLNRVGKSKWDFYRCLDAGKWMTLDNEPLTTPLTPGQAFWYKRVTPSGVWDVSSGAYE